jgi:hypothetical protein
VHAIVKEIAMTRRMPLGARFSMIGLRVIILHNRRAAYNGNRALRDVVSYVKLHPGSSPPRTPVAREAENDLKKTQLNHITRALVIALCVATIAGTPLAVRKMRALSSLASARSTRRAREKRPLRATVCRSQSSLSVIAISRRMKRYLRSLAMCARPDESPLRSWLTGSCLRAPALTTGVAALRRHPGAVSYSLPPLVNCDVERRAIRRILLVKNYGALPQRVRRHNEHEEEVIRTGSRR